MGFLAGIFNILTTLAGLGVAVGAAMEAAGVNGGTEIMAAATAAGLVLAKDGANKEDK